MPFLFAEVQEKFADEVPDFGAWIAKLFVNGLHERMKCISDNFSAWTSHLDEPSAAERKEEEEMLRRFEEILASDPFNRFDEFGANTRMSDLEFEDLLTRVARVRTDQRRFFLVLLPDRLFQEMKDGNVVHDRDRFLFHFVKACRDDEDECLVFEIVHRAMKLRDREDPNEISQQALNGRSDIVSSWLHDTVSLVSGRFCTIHLRLFFPFSSCVMSYPWNIKDHFLPAIE